MFNQKFIWTVLFGLFGATISSVAWADWERVALRQEATDRDLFSAITLAESKHQKTVTIIWNPDDPVSREWKHVLWQADEDYGDAVSFVSIEHPVFGSPVFRLKDQEGHFGSFRYDRNDPESFNRLLRGAIRNIFGEIEIVSTEGKFLTKILKKNPEYRKLIREAGLAPAVFYFRCEKNGCCVNLDSVMAQLSGEYAQRLNLVTVNTDGNKWENNIPQLPLVIVFKNGKLVGRLGGCDNGDFCNLESLRAFFDDVLRN